MMMESRNKNFRQCNHCLAFVQLGSVGRNFEPFQKAVAAGGGGHVTASLVAKALGWHMALTSSLEDEETIPPRWLADFDSVASPRRGAQSGDTKTSKTRTRRRITTSPFKERGPRGVARARIITTSRQWQKIDEAMIIIKKESNIYLYY